MADPEHWLDSVIAESNFMSSKMQYCVCLLGVKQLSEK